MKNFYKVVLTALCVIYMLAMPNKSYAAEEPPFTNHINGSDDMFLYVLEVEDFNGMDSGGISSEAMLDYLDASTFNSSDAKIKLLTSNPSLWGHFKKWNLITTDYLEIMGSNYILKDEFYSIGNTMTNVSNLGSYKLDKKIQDFLGLDYDIYTSFAKKIQDGIVTEMVYGIVAFNKTTYTSTIVSVYVEQNGGDDNIAVFAQRNIPGLVDIESEEDLVINGKITIDSIQPILGDIEVTDTGKRDILKNSLLIQEISTLGNNSDYTYQDVNNTFLATRNVQGVPRTTTTDITIRLGINPQNVPVIMSNLDNPETVLVLGVPILVAKQFSANREIVAENLDISGYPQGIWPYFYRPATDKIGFEGYAYCVTQEGQYASTNTTKFLEQLVKTYGVIDIPPVDIDGDISNGIDIPIPPSNVKKANSNTDAQTRIFDKIVHTCLNDYAIAKSENPTYSLNTSMPQPYRAINYVWSESMDKWATMMNVMDDIASEFDNTKSYSTMYDFVTAMMGERLAKLTSNTSVPDTYYTKIAGQQTLISDKAYGDVSSFATKLTFSEMWNRLSVQQRYNLATVYEQMLDERSKDKYSTAMGWIQKPSVSSLNSTVNVNGQDIFDYVNTVLGGIKEVQFTDSVLTTVSLNHFTTAYTLYRAFGSSANSKTGAEGGLYSIYNADMEQLVGLRNNLKGQPPFAEKRFIPSQIPTLDNSYGSIVDLEEYNKFIWQLYMIAYDFEIASSSDYGASNGLVDEGLKDAIDKVNNTSIDVAAEALPTEASAFQNKLFKNLTQANAATADITREQSIWLLSIIQLHDTCEMLGITKGMWTETIDKYLAIYNDPACNPIFEALRLNPSLYSFKKSLESTLDEPLASFFSANESTLDAKWLKGYAASATFIPLETNVYNADAYNVVNDKTWLVDYYYRYGYYRKALRISTNSSALTKSVVTGSLGNETKIATLADLLEYDRDIILYIDDSLYNADTLINVLNGIDIKAAMENYEKVASGSEETETETAIKDASHYSSVIGQAFTLQPEEFLKYGVYHNYKQDLAQTIASIPNKSNYSLDVPSSFYLLTKEETLEAIQAYNYSTKLPYGVISSIYRNVELFNLATQAIASDNAIFKSSKGVCSTPGAKETDFLDLYNYMMLSNLDNVIKNSVAQTLDLNEPLFCDIFGNILTESGYVVIPAASNPTLNQAYWQPYNIGFASLYYSGNFLDANEIPQSARNFFVTGDSTQDYNSSNITTVTPDRNRGGGWFTIDSNNRLVLRDNRLDYYELSELVQWNLLSKNNKNLNELFYAKTFYESSEKLKFTRVVNIILETLRGAPLSAIDFEKEGLETNTLDANSVVSGLALETLLESIYNGAKGAVANATVSIPDINRLPYVEYIMLYLAKILIALGTVYCIIVVTKDALETKFGIMSIVRTGITISIIIITVRLVPDLLSISYYQSNKALLSEEAEYIAALNYAKSFDNYEVGMTKITTPKSNSKIYLKLAKVDIPWYKMINEVMFSDTAKTVDDCYKELLSEDPRTTNPNIMVKSDGLYMDVVDLFNSTHVNYLPSSKVMVNYTQNMNTEEVGVASFSIPYYVFLQNLVDNVNVYNNNNSVETYAYTVAENGHIQTYNIVAPYLLSSEFQDDIYDMFDLTVLYDTGDKLLYHTASDVVDIGQYKMRDSNWYNDNLTTEEAYERITKFYKYTREYIIDNQYLMGKMSDEVFLKMLALHCSIEYNRLFGITTCSSYELFGIDNRDLYRFMIGDKGEVFKYYTFSVARYAGVKSGAFGSMLFAILILINMAGSLLKTILMLVMFLLFCINVLFVDTIFSQRSKAVEGYIIGLGLMMANNALYALMLKLCMTLQNYGFNTVLTAIMGICMQVLYLFVLVMICKTLTKDWRNVGFNQYQNAALHATGWMSRTFSTKHSREQQATNYNTRFAARNPYGYVQAMHRKDALDSRAARRGRA